MSEKIELEEISVIKSKMEAFPIKGECDPEIRNVTRPKRNVKPPAKLNDFTHPSSKDFKEILKTAALKRKVKKRKMAASSNKKDLINCKRKVKEPEKFTPYFTQSKKNVIEPVIIPVKKGILRENKIRKLDESKVKKIDVFPLLQDFEIKVEAIDSDFSSYTGDNEQVPGMYI